MNSAVVSIFAAALVFASGLLFGSSEAASLTARSDGGLAKVVCYLGSWANYRDGKGKFVIEDIDPKLCTHLVYGFAKLENNRIAAYDPYLDLKDNYGLGAYERFNGLRKANPGLKTLIAIGGWNEGSTKYSKMASSSQTRKVFIDSCVEFLKRHEFDGLDVDWEYPANRGGSPEDKGNFVLLLKELREAFKPYGFLLTAAVSAGKATIDKAYDIPAVSRYLDFINLMAYDFDGAWSSATGYNAPLYARPDGDQTLNVEFAVKYWLEKGAPAGKIVLGMPLYGRSFTLRNPDQNGVGVPSSEKGPAGPYTREPGFLGYNEICEMLQSGSGWEVVFDSAQKVPYTYNGKQWISFDNTRSISLKVNFVKKYKLGGAMVWSIETDDFKGVCSGGRYPLLNKIKKGLQDHIPEPSGDPVTEKPCTPPTSTTPTPKIETEAPTEATVITKGMCKAPGYFPHPKSCKRFIRCVQLYPSGLQVYEFDCPPGTVYNTRIMMCTYPHEFPECKEPV